MKNLKIIAMKVLALTAFAFGVPLIAVQASETVPKSCRATGQMGGVSCTYTGKPNRRYDEVNTNITGRYRRSNNYVGTWYTNVH